MQRRVLFGLLIHFSLLLFTSAALVRAQTARKADSEGRDTAGTILLQAAKINGLAGSDLKPWQLQVSYRFLDATGKATDQGSIEEQRIAPNMAKLSITGSSGRLVYLTTKKGVYREGEVNEKMALLELVAASFVQPLNLSEKALEYLGLSLQTRATGSGQLRCFTLKTLKGVHSTFNDPTYCLDGTRPILRTDSFADDPHQFVWNHIGNFQGQYVPMEVVVGDRAGTVLSAHVEGLKEIPEPNQADFNPDADAELIEPAHELLVVRGDGLEQMIRIDRVRVIRSPQPEYPAAARAANIRGTVTLRALIGTDGHIEELHVIDGPELLRQAALDAVWQWRFEPPFHGSEHVRILGEISVRF